MQTEVEAPVEEPLSFRERHPAVRQRSPPSRGSTWPSPGRGRWPSSARRAAASRRCWSWWPASRSPMPARDPARRHRRGGHAARRAPTCPSATCCCPGATRSATPRSRWSARACRARRRAAPLSRSSSASGSPSSSTRARPSCRAGCASASPSCARCCRAGRCSCLDEPFGALDAITRARLQRVARRRARR